MHLSRSSLLLVVFLFGCQTTRPEGNAVGSPAPGTGDDEVIPAAFDAPAPTGPKEKEAAALPEVFADEEPAARPPGPLTLEGLERIALGSNPTIPQAAALVGQQQGITKQAGLYPNPQAGYLRSDPDQAGQSRTQGVFLSQEFVTAGKLRLAREASRHDVVLRSWQLDAQKHRVVNDVRIRFFEVLGAQESVAAARELERSAADGVRIAKAMIDARQGTRPDLLQAQMQLGLAQGALKDALFRLEAGRRQLASVVGLPELPPGDLAGTLEDAVPQLDWEPCLQRLLQSSPLLRSQEAELRAARTEVDLARAQAIPNLSVQMVAQRDAAQNYSSVSTLFALPVPIFNRNQGGILQAEAFLMQQQREYDRLRHALADQLAASMGRYASLRSESARVRDELLPLAEENLKLTSDAYRLGRMGFLRVVDARRTYFQTRMNLIDTLAELHKVVAEIEGLQLTGALNPTEVGTALQSTSGRPGAGARNVLLQQLQNQNNNVPRNLPGAIQAAEQ